MNVALTTEGTYPYHFGGVSVWCDQLIRGLPDYRYTVVSLVGTGAEQVAWPLPDNVSSLIAVPLWEPGRASRRKGRRGADPSIFLLYRLVDTLLDTSARAQQRFGGVLREIFEYAQHADLTAGFASQEAVRVVTEAWQQRWPAGGPQPPTLHDALTAVQLLEHSLRPLSQPPVRADVVHASTNGLAALPALTAKWRYGTPVIITEHGIYLREHYLACRPGPYRWTVKALFLAFQRRLCALGYQEAAVIAPGNVYNRRWEERLGARPAIIRTVYNGVDPANFPAIAGEPGVPSISWVGRIDPIKDLETLLRAFSLVHRNMPEARLRLFGSPPKGREPYLERCRALAADLGIAEAATFEGRVGNVRDAYAAGSIVVLSSVSEGFPYSLIEAMTCGRACVATDVGGVAEAVGDTGFLVPSRSPEPMARACLALLADAGLRRRLGAAARARALEFFTLDGAITAFDEIYGLLGSGRPMPTAVPEPDPVQAPDDLLQPGAA